MNEGAFSSEPIGDADPTTSRPASSTAGGSPVPGSGWGDQSDDAKDASAGPPAATRKILLIALLLLVVGLPICVGVFAFMNPSHPTSENVVEGALGELGTDADPDEIALSGPRWVRPSWSDSMVGVTAFELPAANEVLQANGRLRPTLGVTCSAEKTDVHIVTGGTALVDPQTFGHVVHLTFDDASEQIQQWTAADDMRALFSPEPLAMAAQIKRSSALQLGFSHYMTGRVVVEFDLRGADEVLDSMAEPCGWDKE